MPCYSATAWKEAESQGSFQSLMGVSFVQYSDNSYKFVAVLNGKYELPRLVNASLHITAGLISGASTELKELMQFEEYRDATDQLRACVSHYPFIILQAKNGNQLKTLSAAARQAGLTCADFADTMLGSSAEAQLDATRRGDDSTFDLLAVCLFGSADQLDLLTRKFSLFRGGASRPDATTMSGS